MSIPTDIATCPDRMSELALQLRAHVQAIRAVHPCQEVMDETAGVVLVIAALGAESARMRSLLAAARSTGQVERELVVTDLELHPKRQHAQVEHERLLASLHRVADHTLDPDEKTDATQRGPTTGGKD